MHQIAPCQALRLPSSNRTLPAHIGLPIPEQRIGLFSGLTLDADDGRQLSRLTCCTTACLALLDRVGWSDDQHHSPRHVTAQARKGVFELGLIQAQIQGIVERFVGAVGENHQIWAQQLERVLPARLPFVLNLEPSAIDAQG
ncbi:hypothetical protein D3C84_764010 [compost metagenome]